MSEKPKEEPDSTAVRVALWRALHVETDPPPYVLISVFTPAEMVALARESGFRDAQHVSAAVLTQRYFAGRTDGLRPPNNAEELLVATT